MKNQKDFLKINGGIWGAINFNNMIPVHKDALINFDINAEKDVKYRRLLQHQIQICNRMKADILNHAQKTYFDVVNKTNTFLINISCDFKKLEKLSKKYNYNYIPPKK